MTLDATISDTTHVHHVYMRARTHTHTHQLRSSHTELFVGNSLWEEKAEQERRSSNRLKSCKAGLSHSALVQLDNVID